MTTHAYTEDQLVEQPAIGLFGALGWQTMSAMEETVGPAGSLGRETKGEVVLAGRLHAALALLNPGVPPEALQRAADELVRDRSAMSLEAANREIYELLKDGKRVGMSMFNGYSYNERCLLSLAVVDASVQIGELRLACTPARHLSGRFLSRNNTLWASFAVVGPEHRVYFGGDTGYTGSFSDIGTEHGPFDLTVLPIGAYNKSWPDIHMNPEEALRAHRDLNGDNSGVLMPIHWATFRLAPHPWAEPAERLTEAAAAEGVEIAVPKPGGRVVVGRVPKVDHWWKL